MTDRAPAPLEALLAHRSRLLSFVRSRVSDPFEAEDILQGALARVLERPGDVPLGHTVPWFYRVLRPGLVSATEPLQWVQRHYPELSVARLLEWYVHTPLERCALRQMLACDALAPAWRKVAERRLASGELEDWQARLYGCEPARTAESEGVQHA